jgi:hypothetical protein
VHLAVEEWTLLKRSAGMTPAESAGSGCGLFSRPIEPWRSVWRAIVPVLVATPLTSLLGDSSACGIASVRALSLVFQPFPSELELELESWGWSCGLDLGEVQLTRQADAVMYIILATATEYLR